MVAANDGVGAAGADGCVSVEVRIGVIAAGQLQSEDDAAGHIRGKPSVHAQKTDVAQGVMLESGDAAIILGGDEQSVPIGYLRHHAPIAVEHVLQACRIKTS